MGKGEWVNGRDSVLWVSAVPGRWSGTCCGCGWCRCTSRVVEFSVFGRWLDSAHVAASLRMLRLLLPILQPLSKQKKAMLPGVALHRRTSLKDSWRAPAGERFCLALRENSFWHCRHRTRTVDNFRLGFGDVWQRGGGTGTAGDAGITRRLPDGSILEGSWRWCFSLVSRASTDANVAHSSRMGMD